MGQPVATNIDSQLTDMVEGSASCGDLAIKRAREYAAQAHFIGLLAGIVGTKDERDAARQAVIDALTEIGFAIGGGDQRALAMQRQKEWLDLKYNTRTSGMNAEQLAAHNQRVAAAEAAANEAITAQESYRKWGTPANMLNNGIPETWDSLWNSLRSIYDKAVKFVREDMWKKSACELSLDAGFFLLENGVAVALSAIGLAAAAAFLKIVGIASKGLRLVKISVTARRGLKAGGLRTGAKEYAEKAYKYEIDTGNINRDAKAFLDESGQGGSTKPDRDPRQGDEPDGKTPDDSERPEHKKGRKAEEAADQWAKNQGWKPLMQSGKSSNANGIDGIYEIPGTPPKYTVVEVKGGNNDLGWAEGSDGGVVRQMSDQWIADRLPNAVDRATLDKLDEFGYQKKLIRVDEQGNVTVQDLGPNSYKWRKTDDEAERWRQSEERRAQRTRQRRAAKAQSP